ncbi:hypothetical protein SAMN06297144_1917 [Sphingomonas guangdongensis]|uniref:Uncharacterized protein n=1 Tax=Sphingomonas guangdongensis TaxID=1141890 RepID=A0A285R372_9SPHN|nr:hypothetical protein [Sphingomonas guangdongensis]SOB86807.1 hypothetical protein SAMN06297144_1917 [Sphingomonas guangdongensis]
MSRPLVILIVAAVVLVVGLFVLAGRDTSVAPTRVEKAVSLEKLS